MTPTAPFITSMGRDAAMNDFLLRALLAGTMVAIVSGPLGAFMVWRRMAYFGSAVSHSALLGVAAVLLIYSGVAAYFGASGRVIGPLDESWITLGVMAFCVILGMLLLLLECYSTLPSDTLIGLLAHIALAGGLVALSLLPNLRVDLLGYLFGDILAVSWRDFALIAVVAASVLAVLALIWRPLLALTVHADLAAVEGVKARGVEITFMILVAVAVAVGMRVVGILLIVSLLIIPAAAARRFSATPEMMAVLASLIGVVSVAGGLLLSLKTDAQTGPAIVLVAGVMFLASLFAGRRAPAAREAPPPATPEF